MGFEKWMDLYKQIEELENEVTEGRDEWMQQEIGSSFSYYLYQRRLEEYQKKWNEVLTVGAERPEDKFTEDLCEFGMIRLKDVRKQAMINRDDFPEDAQVTKRAEKIIQEAERLLDYCNNI